jgi:copper transport protein
MNWWLGRIRRWRLAAIAALLAVIWVADIASGEAFAHASLVGSEPADGAVLVRAPDRLTLTFNEAVSPLVIRILDSDGSERRIRKIDQQNARLVVTAEPLERGTHVLNWRVVSADGHPVGGAIVFSIGAPTARVAAAPSGDSAVRFAIWLVRWLVYGSLFVGVGGVFFCRWIAGNVRRDVERMVLGALWIGAAAAPISLGLHGLDLLGVPFSRIFHGEIWLAGVHSAYAATVRIGLAAILLALVAFRIHGRAEALLLSSVALVGVGLALAASGHASAAEPQFLMRPAVFLHGIGIAFWIGALLPLRASLRRAGARARATLVRFSRVAPLAVLPLIASGIAIAFVQVGSPSSLWTTAYGQLLLCKGALLAVLFWLAAWNRYLLSQRVAVGHARATHRLVRSIQIELALALTIFAVAAAWRFTPPPRSLEAAASAPAIVHIRTGRTIADVLFEPGRAGPVRAIIRPLMEDLRPLAAKEIALVLANQAAGIDSIRRSAAPLGEGAWLVDGLTIPLAGRWQVQVELLVGDFEKITLADSVVIRP